MRVLQAGPISFVFVIVVYHRKLHKTKHPFDLKANARDHSQRRHAAAIGCENARGRHLLVVRQLVLACMLQVPGRHALWLRQTITFAAQAHQRCLAAALSDERSLAYRTARRWDSQVNRHSAAVPRVGLA
jgi:hypothetical protein